MKYSLFTVSIPEFTPRQALAKMKEAGYDGVDWRVTQLPKDEAIQREAPSYWRNNLCTIDIHTIEEEAPALKALCAEYALEINALATYLDAYSDEEDIATCMRAARTLGCKRIRVNAPKYDRTKHYNDIFADAVKGFAKVERLAKQYGIKTDFEMHMGTITPSASAARALASHFDPKFIGVIYDTGNVIYEGLEDYKMALEILGPYLDLIHIKNAKWEEDKESGRFKPTWASFQKGFADFKDFIKVLKEWGYDGYITFEDFSSEEDSWNKLKNNLHYIKTIEEGI